jgi:aminopeptidase-like protein
MNAGVFSEPEDLTKIGKEMYQLIADLYPICRSITGNGFRESLHMLKKYIALETHEIPSGTPVFDWIVPREWSIRDAYIKNARGERIIDFKKSNLHVVSYSTPISTRMALSKLKEHLFSIPDHPDWIPYKTSYYADNWGFCLSHRALQQLQDGEYEVCIDSTLEKGSLTYGEYYLAGRNSDEVLISCHCCHPSLCNDNLSGMALAAFLARYLSQLPLKYSYRFVFIPATIGAIAWLYLNQSKVSMIKHGLVVAGVGDAGKMRYKKSRQGDAEIDRIVIHMLRHSGQDHEILEFSPYGYDERQYCSPGFNLAVGSLTRTPFGCYPEYHTSADNLDLVQPTYLADSFSKYVRAIKILESNNKYTNTNPKCEPQLGRRGLYTMMGGRSNTRTYEMAMLWVLNLSDGDHSLLDIADRAGIEFGLIAEAAAALLNHGLLKE